MYGLVMDMDFPMCGLSVAAQGRWSTELVANHAWITLLSRKGRRTDYATTGLAQHANHV